jgi:clan AA aspartic protease
LVLKSKKGNEITVDTGFIGTVALPEKVLKKMGLKPIGTGVFTLADGSTVSLPIYWGQIKIKNKDFQTWFIPCDYLLGMELLELAGDCLSLDFRQQTVRLESRGIA